MKRLLLLRHAKAEREGPDDRKRGLEKRGEKDSARMGCFLREDVYIPDLVLSSDAARTRLTLKFLLPELGAAPDVRYLAELYLAEPELIVSLIRRASDKVGSLMIVGHNPGLAQCALALAAVPSERKPRKRYDAMDEKFPTCALAVIDFDVAKWSDVRPALGDLDTFVRPKDLSPPSS